jgi:hypothetical protein
MSAMLAETADDFDLDEVETADAPLPLAICLPDEDRTDHLRRFDIGLYDDEIVMPLDLLDGTLSIPTTLPLLEPLERHVRAELFHLRIPWRWRAEGVLAPSWESRIQAFAIFRNLLSTYGLVPRDIDPSIEGGVTLTYRHHESERVLVLEVYNGFEAAGVVSDDRKVLYSEDIQDSELDTLVAIFRGTARPTLNPESASFKR